MTPLLRGIGCVDDGAGAKIEQVHRPYFGSKSGKIWGEDAVRNIPSHIWSRNSTKCPFCLEIMTELVQFKVVSLASFVK